MRKGLQRECAWNALRNYHVIWLENLENQGNKIRIVSLRGRFWALDLTKTKRGWHRVDRNERWTVLHNIYRDMQFCLVSSVLRCLPMNVVFMNGEAKCWYLFCRWVGSDFQKPLLRYERRWNSAANFRLMCWCGNFCDTHVTWVGLFSGCTHQQSRVESSPIKSARVPVGF
jgi:hypothetical protein